MDWLVFYSVEKNNPYTITLPKKFKKNRRKTMYTKSILRMKIIENNIYSGGIA